MRIYEFSKKYNIPSKKLIEELKSAGFEIASHMSVVPEEAMDLLHKKFNGEAQLKDNHHTNKVVAVKKQQEQAIISNIDLVEKNTTAPAVKISDVNVASLSKVPEINAPVKPEANAPVKVVFDQEQTLATFAEKIEIPASEVILTLLKWGIVVNKNQNLTKAIVARLAEHFGVRVEVKKVENVEQDLLKSHLSTGEDAIRRLPVVVVLGHVDHGKTTLLDYIRKTRVAHKEKGGITQHLGAYEVATPQGNIIFLDTPGHEAFSRIRSRGIKVADVAILVVAADDGIKPQTIEAIQQAKKMELPLIVAVNKMDKVDPARIDVVKKELAQHGVLVEDWGGDVVCVPISAKMGDGITSLLEMVVLQSEMMDLRAKPTGDALGYVLESKLEKGRGPVATVLCQEGEIKVGDFISAGGFAAGKVTSIIDSSGASLKRVGPSIPVQIAGFKQLAKAGDIFKSRKKSQLQAADGTDWADRVLQDDARVNAAKGAINIMITTDTHSSREALVDSIKKLSIKTAKDFGKEFNILTAGIGGVHESDVDLAYSTGALIVALHTKKDPNVGTLAQKLGVTIETFDIIYKLLDYLQEVARGERIIKYVQKKVGEAVVRRVFTVKGLGSIAGCYVRSGTFTKDGFVVALRGKHKIGEGAIVSLQRDKKNVKEVHTGYECAFVIEGIDNWEDGDVAECFVKTAV